ncbi:MAG: hypothetical protein IT292_09940 [Deltaproteobacteria bacterium]|nr:hypothetical protein [Deltaproteobacteria bacterium]
MFDYAADWLIGKQKSDGSFADTTNKGRSIFFTTAIAIKPLLMLGATK